MQTWLIDEAQPLPMDPELEAVLRFGESSETGGGGIALNLGILDARGRVYRVARSWNLTDYVVACKALERMGLNLVTTPSPPAIVGLSFEDVFAWQPETGAAAPNLRCQDALILPSPAV